MGKIVFKRALIFQLWLCFTFGILYFYLQQRAWLSHFIFLYLISALFNVALLIEVFSDLLRDKRLTASYLFKGVVLLFPLILLMSHIITNSRDNFLVSQNQNFFVNRIASFFKARPQSSIYMFTVSIVPFSFTLYAPVDYLPPWPNAWMAPGAANIKPSHPVTGWRKRWLDKYEDLFVQQVVSDFVYKKPEFVLVNHDEVMLYGKKAKMNFIGFLTRNEVFAKIWQHYHLVKTFPPIQIYQRT